MVKNRLQTQKILVSESGFRCSPKSNQLVLVTHPTCPTKFHLNSSITFWCIMLTDKQSNKQTDKQGWKHNLRPPSLAEVITGVFCFVCLFFYHHVKVTFVFSFLLQLWGPACRSCFPPYSRCSSLQECSCLEGIWHPRNGSPSLEASLAPSFSSSP